MTPRRPRHHLPGAPADAVTCTQGSCHQPQSSAVASAIARWPGIDIRGPGYRLGGYLAGPGSVVDGQPYIIERNAPIRDLPGWLAAILSRHTGRLQRQATSTPRRTPCGVPKLA